eukprot:TRINITY_DN1321_c0_g1_i1.p1 TRINITY_DN1321_c0_g1~~TRINITY_DN1321_c0_g1_i1.p1  ORF type:complete len:817 (-),score=217.57 TRINITY_DN1321_c0_g1_i1:331-2523(-)
MDFVNEVEDKRTAILGMIRQINQMHSFELIARAAEILDGIRSRMGDDPPESPSGRRAASKYFSLRKSMFQKMKSLQDKEMKDQAESAAGVSAYAFARRFLNDMLQKADAAERVPESGSLSEFLNNGVAYSKILAYLDVEKKCPVDPLSIEDDILGRTDALLENAKTLGIYTGLSSLQLLFGQDVSHFEFISAIIMYVQGKELSMLKEQGVANEEDEDEVRTLSASELRKMMKSRQNSEAPSLNQSMKLPGSLLPVSIPPEADTAVSVDAGSSAILSDSSSVGTFSVGQTASRSAVASAAVVKDDQKSDSPSAADALGGSSHRGSLIGRAQSPTDSSVSGQTSPPARESSGVTFKSASSGYSKDLWDAKPAGNAMLIRALSSKGGRKSGVDGKSPTSPEAASPPGSARGSMFGVEAVGSDQLNAASAGSQADSSQGISENQASVSGQDSNQVLANEESKSNAADAGSGGDALEVDAAKETPASESVKTEATPHQAVHSSAAPGQTTVADKAALKPEENKDSFVTPPAGAAVVSDRATAPPVAAITPGEDVVVSAPSLEIAPPSLSQEELLEGSGNEVIASKAGAVSVTAVSAHEEKLGHKAGPDEKELLKKHEGLETIDLNADEMGGSPAEAGMSSSNLDEPILKDTKNNDLGVADEDGKVSTLGGISELEGVQLSFDPNNKPPQEPLEDEGRPVIETDECCCWCCSWCLPCCPCYRVKKVSGRQPLLDKN